MVLSIIRMVSAPISTFSSIIIMVMICRSPTKLSTTRDRLLFGLSISDMIFSIAVSLGTIPMPRQTPNVWIPMGNFTTCEIQAFLITFSGTVAPCYNAGMCIFSLLKVTFNMDDNKIRTKVEPFLHIVPFIISLSTCIYCTVKNYFNPAIAICTLIDYPFHCSRMPNVPCERGENLFEDWGIIIYGLAPFFLVPLIIIISMGVICMTVWKQERKLKNYSQELDQAITTTDNESLMKSKTVMYQGLAYSGAWLIYTIFPLIQLMCWIAGRPSGFLLNILIAIFSPLQGFFNLLVFLFPRIRATCQSETGCSLFRTFISVVQGENRTRRPNGIKRRGVLGANRV